MPQIKFDFYKVKVGDDSPVSFKEALDDILSQQIQDRNVEIDGYNCFMSSSLELKGSKAYLFTKLRMDELPSKTKITGERHDLELDEDEGLSEDVVIAYNQNLNVVAVQRNRYSLSVNNIIRLIKEENKDITSIAFLPILKKDALARFSSMNQLKKLRIKLAGTNNINFLKDSGLGTDEKMILQKLLQSPYVDLTLSVGRSSGGLGESLKSMAEKFTDLFHKGYQSEILAVEVSGKVNDDAPTMLIDLLEDRLIYNGEISLENRRININKQMSIAIDAINSNKLEF